MWSFSGHTIPHWVKIPGQWGSARNHSLCFHRPWSRHLTAGIFCSKGPKLRVRSILQCAGWISYKGWPKTAVCRGGYMNGSQTTVFVCVLVNSSEEVSWCREKEDGLEPKGFSSFWTSTFWGRTFQECFAHTVSFNPAQCFRVIFLSSHYGNDVVGSVVPNLRSRITV